MDGFHAWAAQLDFTALFDLLLPAAAALCCVTIHEMSHGYAACLLGDPTAKNAGRLTLNPLRHIDLMGLLAMVLVKFGWAKPVPVDPRHFKKPKRDMALTALAGPVSNVVLAYGALCLSSALLWCCARNPGSVILRYVYLLFYYMAVLSAGLAVFNIFPIPPLDGSKVLFACLSDRAYERLMRYERYGMGLLMLLLITGLIDTPLSAMRSWLLTWLGNWSMWGYTLPKAIF